MAGTLTLETDLLHVYQRRFEDVPALQTALADSHIYLITRRPATRVESVRRGWRGPSVLLSSRTAIEQPPTTHAFTLRDYFGKPRTRNDFTVLGGGAYFAYELDDQLLHGDAWALASFLTQAGVVAQHEVLYIGKAYGTHGSRNAGTRLQAHSTLQRIYEDHAGEPWDIFVAPLLIDRMTSTNQDHIDDDAPGFDFDVFTQYFDGEGRFHTDTMINVVEQGLIAYFAPAYNKLLRPVAGGKPPTQAMRRLQEVGFRRLTINLMGWTGLARFYSQAAPSPYRAHSIFMNVPEPPAYPSLSGTEVRDLPIAPPQTLVGDTVERWAHRQLVQGNEFGPVILRIFGNEAPAVRRPPEITLPT